MDVAGENTPLPNLSSKGGKSSIKLSLSLLHLPQPWMVIVMFWENKNIAISQILKHILLFAPPRPHKTDGDSWKFEI